MVEFVRNSWILWTLRKDISHHWIPYNKHFTLPNIYNNFLHFADVQSTTWLCVQLSFVKDVKKCVFITSRLGISPMKLQMLGSLNVKLVIAFLAPFYYLRSAVFRLTFLVHCVKDTYITSPRTTVAARWRNHFALLDSIRWTNIQVEALFLRCRHGRKLPHT